MGELTADKLLLFVLMALPGAIAIRVYALWCPTAQKDWKESLTDAVIYSVIGLVFWVVFFPEPIQSFVTTAFLTTSEDKTQSGLLKALIDHRHLVILYTVATPVVLACIWYGLRLRVFPRLLGFDHPTRTAWDWVFSRKKPFYMIVFLKTRGEGNTPVKMVGYYGGNSYVTSHPHEPEVFLERVHRLNSDGTIGLPIPDTDGMLIRSAEIERVEFLTFPGATEFVPFYRRWVGSGMAGLKKVYHRATNLNSAKEKSDGEGQG